MNYENRVYCYLEFTLKWKIVTNSNKFIKINGLPEVELLNPLYYYSLDDLLPKDLIHSVVKLKNTYFIETNGIVFNKLFEEKIDHDKFRIKVANLIKYVKSVTMQSSIGNYNIIEGIFESSFIDLNKIPNQENPYALFINGYQLNSMITFSDIRKADKLMINEFEILIYEEIFIEAWNDLLNSEYRKAILNFAIASEIMLLTKLEEEYQKRLSKKNNSSIRITAFNTINGEIWKDPIYLFLKEKSNFSTLLHELPLYLQKKSLLVDNQKLYQEARQLYSTRNKLVHKGVSGNEGNKTLDISYEGAYKASEITNSLFKWMKIVKFDKKINSEGIMYNVTKANP